MPPRVLKATPEQRYAIRKGRLNDTDWLTIRHRDQDEGGHLTTLSADQYQALLGYRQALRDWPPSGDVSEAFPLAPSFITTSQGPASSL